MMWRQSGLASVLVMLLVIEMHPAPAEACGVKLTINVARPKKAAARSARPSNVLVVGSSPRRLERDLKAAGHDVEVAPRPQEAKRPSYAVIVVSSEDEAKAARSKFGDAVVVMRTGDIGTDLKTVENQVSRQPVGAAKPRPVVAAGPSRAPIAAPTQEPRKVVATKEPASETPTPVAAPPAATATAATPKAATPPAATATVATPKAATPPPAATATVAPPRPATPPKAAEQPPAPPRVATDTKRDTTATTSGALDNEVFFSLNSSTVSGNDKSLDVSVKWLTANVDVHVTLEGYADPTGTPEVNMALSQARAEAVRDYLVAAGIDVSRIEVKTFGDTKIKYGRADGRNRRVAIVAKK